MPLIYNKSLLNWRIMILHNPQIHNCWPHHTSIHKVWLVFKTTHENMIVVCETLETVSPVHPFHFNLSLQFLHIMRNTSIYTIPSSLLLALQTIYSYTYLVIRLWIENFSGFEESIAHNLVVGGLGWVIDPNILGSVPNRSSPRLHDTQF